jgi:hypothetical protein
MDRILGLERLSPHLDQKLRRVWKPPVMAIVTAAAFACPASACEANLFNSGKKKTVPSRFTAQNPIFTTDDADGHRCG